LANLVLYLNLFIKYLNSIIYKNEHKFIQKNKCLIKIIVNQGYNDKLKREVIHVLNKQF